MRVTLNAGDSTEATYPIDLYYGLARAGRYTVQLMREVPSQKKHLTQSNEVVLNVAERFTRSHSNRQVAKQKQSINE